MAKTHTSQAIREQVRKGYARIAVADNRRRGKGSASSCCGPSSCCGQPQALSAEEIARTVGYSADDLAVLPAGANMGLSCGNPVAIAQLKAGEVVLDLGSGGGFDVFQAARRVGAKGRAIGVDMTPEMLAKALHAFRQQVEEKERARLRLVDGVVQAQEEERKTIARELHDHLGQSLTGLLLTIQSRVSAEQMPAGVRDEIVAQIRRLSGEMHQLAWGLRPPILDDYGLDSVLSSYVESIAKPSGLQVDYQYTHPEPRERLPARVEVTLYRVVQEALTNTIRHARATRVSVVVLHRQQDVTLIVEDDGQGFDPERVSPDRLGLTGMRERVALLGGACTIESKPGNGATVWIRIPLPRDPPCPSAS